MADAWQYNQRLIGEILRRARTLTGLSIRDLSARSSVSTSQILRVESGEFDIMLSTLLKLAHHVGLPAGLILEQGAIPNPGFYAKLIGQTGVSLLIEEIPATDRSRNVRTRVILLCTQAATVAASLMQSSNASKLVTSLKAPLKSIDTGFSVFATKVDALTVEDRVSLQRELDEDPLAVLSRFDLVTGTIAAEFCAHVDGHAHLQLDFFKLI